MQAEDFDKTQNMKLSLLQEHVLIKKAFLKYILPITIIGFIAFLLPWVYAFIPVYEAEQCWSYFNNRKLLSMECPSTADGDPQGNPSLN